MSNYSEKDEQYGERFNGKKETAKLTSFIISAWFLTFGGYYYFDMMKRKDLFNPLMLPSYMSELRENAERNRKSNSLEGTVGEKFNIGNF